MRPVIYPYLSGDAGVKSIFGAEPRIYPDNDAPENVALPYAVWGVVSSSAENYLGDRPDIDNSRVQIDVYAADSVSKEAAANAIRNALEPWGHQVSINLDERDHDTREYRISFDFEFWQPRQPQ